MHALMYLIHTVIWLYSVVLIGSVVMSWLIAFSVVNTRNQFVAQLNEFLYRVSEPVLKPIRRILPNMGGIDLSPLIALLLLQGLDILLYDNVG